MNYEKKSKFAISWFVWHGRVAPHIHRLTFFISFYRWKKIFNYSLIFAKKQNPVWLVIGCLERVHFLFHRLLGQSTDNNFLPRHGNQFCPLSGFSCWNVQPWKLNQEVQKLSGTDSGDSKWFSKIVFYFILI